MFIVCTFPSRVFSVAAFRQECTLISHFLMDLTWKVGSAKWQLFQELTHLGRDHITAFDIDSIVPCLTGFIIDVAEKRVQQVNGLAYKRQLPW